MGNTVQKLSCFVSKPEEISTFTCEICMDLMAPNQRFKNKTCSHPLCCDCISKYIDSKIHDHTSNLLCPHLGCKKNLDPISCRPIIPAQTFDRWCDVLCESAIAGAYKAYCPYKTCSALVVNECGSSMVTKSKCPDCKRLFCFTCMVPWHAGYRCAEAGVKRDRNDVLFGLLMENRRWQRCPRCNTCVELISGCQAITCRCKRVFCYDCGGNYTISHAFTCKSSRDLSRPHDALGYTGFI